MSPSDILTWIAELRERAKRNELAGHDPINFGYGTTILAERTVRAMLDTLSDLDGRTVRRRDWPAVMARRLDLLRDFRRVREQIG
jgi:hypothetical protein